MDFTKGGRNPRFWAGMRIAKHEFEAGNEQAAANALGEVIKYVDFSVENEEMDSSADYIIRFSHDGIIVEHVHALHPEQLEPAGQRTGILRNEAGTVWSQFIHRFKGIRRVCEAPRPGVTGFCTRTGTDSHFIRFTFAVALEAFEDREVLLLRAERVV